MRERGESIGCYHYVIFSDHSDHSVIECLEKMWCHDAGVKSTDLMLSRFPAIALSFKVFSEKG